MKLAKRFGDQGGILVIPNCKLATEGGKLTKTNTKVILNELDDLKSEARLHPYSALGNLINMTNIYPSADIDESIIDSDIAPRLDLISNIKHKLINDMNDNYYLFVVNDAKKLNKLSNINADFVSCNELGYIDKLKVDNVLEAINNVQYNLKNHV